MSTNKIRPYYRCSTVKKHSKLSTSTQSPRHTCFEENDSGYIFLSVNEQGHLILDKNLRSVSTIENTETYIRFHRYSNSQTQKDSNTSIYISLDHYPYPKVTSVTMIDRKTKWPDAYPVKQITAGTTNNAFINGLVSRFGCPVTITTNKGRQFESELFNKLTKNKLKLTDKSNRSLYL